MFERTQKLLAYEWFERVTPRSLPVVTVIGMRVALDNMAGFERVMNTRLTVNQSCRSEFTPTTVKPEDITPPYYLAGVDADMKQETVAGTRAEGLDGWNWFSAAFNVDTTAFGKAPDAPITLRETDFIPRGKGFLFHDNPAKYTTAVYVDENDLRLVCVSVGDALTVTHRPQDDVFFQNTPNRTARRAIIHALYGTGYTSGVSGVTVEAARGIESPLKSGKIVHIWRENKYNYVATDYELLRMPVEYELAVRVGDDLEAGDCLVKDEKPEYFSIPINGVSYVVHGVHKAADYPGITDAFPELDIKEDGTFLAAELYQLLPKYGIVIKDVKSAVDAGAARALSQYMLPDSAIRLQQRIDVTMKLAVEMSGTCGDKNDFEVKLNPVVTVRCWNFI